MQVLNIVKNVAIIVVGSLVAAALSMKAGELVGELVSGPTTDDATDSGDTTTASVDTPVAGE